MKQPHLPCKFLHFLSSYTCFNHRARKCAVQPSYTSEEHDRQITLTAFRGLRNKLQGDSNYYCEHLRSTQDLSTATNDLKQSHVCNSWEHYMKQDA